MKKIAILSAIALSGLVYNTAEAQISLHLGLHFGHHLAVYAHAPVVVEQAPVYEQREPVYDDSNDEYYYLPDVDAYYDVNQECYFYNDGDRWVSAAYLPGEYRYYDWRNARRYEVRASRPYLHNDVYRSRYNGHAFNGWAHANRDHFNNGYAYRDNRGNDHRFDNRPQGGFERPDPNGRYNNNDRQFNHNQGGYGQPRQNGWNDHRFDNRAQGNRVQPGNNGQRYDNRGEGNNNNRPQPSQGNDHRFDNRGQGNSVQSAQPGNNGQRFDNRGQGNDHQFGNRGQGSSAQPSGQNGGGHDRENRGGNEHFAQNGPQGGLSSHRVMARF